MPRFYFHLTNGNGFSPDADGVELASAAAARDCAMDGIRSIAADEIRAGLIDLTGHVDVADEEGNVLSRVNFTEAFDYQLDGGLHSSYGNEGPDMS